MLDVFLSELTPIGLALGLLASVLLVGLRVKAPAITFQRPRHEAATAATAVGVLTVMFTGLMYVSQSGAEAPTEPTLNSYTLTQVINQLVLGLMLLAPVLIALLLRRQRAGSIGLRRASLDMALIISLVSGLGVFAVLWGWSALSGRVLLPRAFLTPSSMYALLNMGIVGFTEELSFRGYLQTRLVGALGVRSGWVLTSVWMAFVHFPTLLWGEHLGVGAALAGCVAIIPVSLLMGFVMLRCQNVVGPIVLHTFADWFQVFF